ncbi:MAG: type 1 glutamine amidotransferase [Fibrobacteraceae bacterium]|nr:type 1 glutamine amidotransferase [Fibrobacteraceae bacterium]
MTAHIFTHVSFESEGIIADILNELHIAYSHVPLYAGADTPKSSQIDFAIFMGGPMSVLEEREFPFLAKEKELIRTLIQQKKPVLGICLGAQLIANALGAEIIKNPDKEIGWFPISGSSTSKSTFSFPNKTTVFHWHGETFGIPEGALRIAQSKACTNQGFQVGSAIGLQFHIETTEASMQSILSHCSSELSEKSPWIQSEERIKELARTSIPQANALMGKLIRYMLGK